MLWNMKCACHNRCATFKATSRSTHFSSSDVTKQQTLICLVFSFHKSVWNQSLLNIFFMAFTHSMLGCHSLQFACLLYLSDNHSLTIGTVWLNPPTSLNCLCRLNWNNWPDCHCVQFACLYQSLVKNLHRITWRVCSLNCLPHGPCDVNRKSMDLVSCNLHLFICLTHTDTGWKSAHCLPERRVQGVELVQLFMRRHFLKKN